MIFHTIMNDENITEDPHRKHDRRRIPRTVSSDTDTYSGSKSDSGSGSNDNSGSTPRRTTNNAVNQSGDDSDAEVAKPPKLRARPTLSNTNNDAPRSRPRLRPPRPRTEDQSSQDSAPVRKRNPEVRKSETREDSKREDSDVASKSTNGKDESRDQGESRSMVSPPPVRKAPNKRPVRSHPRTISDLSDKSFVAEKDAEDTSDGNVDGVNTDSKYDVDSAKKSTDTGDGHGFNTLPDESDESYDDNADSNGEAMENTVAKDDGDVVSNDEDSVDGDDDFDEQFASFFDDDEIIEDNVSVSPAADNKSGVQQGSRRKGFDKNAIISKYAPLADKRKRNHKHSLDVESGDDADDAVSQKSRYRHYTEQGTVTARQIQFYRNLNLALTYDQHKVADLLSPPTDKQETPEEKVKRERLITQAIGGEEALRRGSKLRISDKDVEALRFLAVFKFANARNVAKMFSESEDTTRKRLNRLRDRGLVLSNKLYGLSTVYFLSEEGMVLSGYSYKTIKKSEINPASFPHTAGTTHLAACLVGADVDVLGFRDHDNIDWPTRNRLVFDENTRDFVRDFGEMVASEFEIQTWLGRRKGNTKGEIYKPKAQADIAFALREWNKELTALKEKARGAGSETERKTLLNDILLHAHRSPEMIYENEWMWALFPRNPANLIHHVPDLVVKRPRDTQDGSPRSIAVELELTAKNDDSSYVKTLTAYKNDKDMYSQVIWVSPTRSIRKKLQKISDKVGLTETGKFRVMPLYYEHGEWPVSEHLGKI